MTEFDLERLGWTPERDAEFEQYLEQGLVRARVAVEHRSQYVLYTEDGELRAELAGRLRHEGELPAVGDWVALKPPSTIVAILPRRTVFSRKETLGATAEQVLAVNADAVFVTTALTERDFKVRRLERYLATAWESGARPVVVLTKSDLCDWVDEAVADVEAIALGVPVHAVSAVTGDGVDGLRPYLAPNQTVALLGSSGVGKSTLVNRLAGREVLATQEIRADGRGRHTTSHRELVPLPGGGLVLDTPGLRELQLWDVSDGLDATFEDVAAIAEGCRFNDCEHKTEPGCAIREALATGALPRDRWESHQKLQRELARLERRMDQRAQAEFGKQIRSEARQRRRAQRPPRPRN
ncbi:MAG: ribosome small subunit-dependent GTPase A [Actinomycetota bacterium]|nr:ribosome small subunit-dependent GTPase A [Actinomycetota bacterium]